MEEGKFKIYILVDPRDQSVRYVGRTINLKQRYEQHLPPSFYTAEEKRLWLLDLRSSGLRPEMQVIDHANDRAEASTKETHWIHRYTESGAQLLNSVCVAQREWAKKQEEWVKAAEARYGSQLDGTE